MRVVLARGDVHSPEVEILMFKLVNTMNIDVAKRGRESRRESASW